MTRILATSTTRPRPAWSKLYLKNRACGKSVMNEVLRGDPMQFKCNAPAMLLRTISIGFMLLATSMTAQQTLAVSPDSPRWQFVGQANATEYQGRKSLHIDGGAAYLKDFEMRDGVIDVDVSTPANRGFFGIQFRIANNGANPDDL